VTRRARIPLAGRVVAVTGGAQGIGRATAAALAARGARVALGDLDLEGARRAAAAIGRGTIGAPLDVRDRGSFTAFLGWVLESLGPVDALVNNAGVMRVGAFLDEPDDWTRRQVDVNLHGVALGMKLALPAMVERGSGHVVTVASLGAHVGLPREATYAATKWAVAGLTESVRAELRGTGVELSLVLPGVVRTALAAGTTTARGVRVIEPEAVAAAIAGVLERPRADVFVPRGYGALVAAKGLLPRRARDGVLRLAGAGRHTERTTRAERAAYEERMAGLTSR
jgi:hypothetical protein